jgi:hypothetical protein
MHRAADLLHVNTKIPVDGHPSGRMPTARQIYGFTALVPRRNDGFWRAGSGYRGPRLGPTIDRQRSAASGSYSE